MKKLLLIILSFICLSVHSETIRKEIIITNSGDTLSFTYSSGTWVLESDTTFVLKTDSITLNDTTLSTWYDLYNYLGIGDIPTYTPLKDSLVLNPNTSTIPTSDYTIWADTLTGLIGFRRGNSAGENYINTTADIPFVNTTGITIYAGTPLSSKGLDVSKGRGLPSVDITNCIDLSLAESFAGVSKGTVLPGEVGTLFKRNFLTYNTSSFNQGDNIYVSCDSSLTNIQPVSPYYKIFVGKVLTVGSNGIIAVNAQSFHGNDTDIGVDGILNGIILEKQSVSDTIISNVLYFETDNELRDTMDLPYMYQKSIYSLNTTTNTGTEGKARVALSYGTSITPQANYIYINHNSGSPTLAVSTTAFPDAGIRVAECGIFDQSTHENYGFAYFQRFNNAVDGSTADGWVNKAAKRIRLDGSKWESGIAPTVALVTDAAAVDSFNLYTNSGIVWQFNRQVADAMTGKKYYWFNCPAGAKWVTDLNQVNTTSTGTTLRSNGDRYGLTVFYVQNSGNFNDILLVAAPTGKYSADADAINDVSNYQVSNVPAMWKGTAIRLARVVVSYSTSSNGTITNLLGTGGYQDQRGFLLGSGSSGDSGGGSVTWPVSDAQFSLSDNTDPTKLMQFELSGITTGTTRTLTAPDLSGTISTVSGVDRSVQYNNSGVSGGDNYLRAFDNDTTLSIINFSKPGLSITNNGSSFSDYGARIRNNGGGIGLYIDNHSTNTGLEVYDNNITAPGNNIINIRNYDGTIFKITDNGSIYINDTLFSDWINIRETDPIYVGDSANRVKYDMQHGLNTNGNNINIESGDTIKLKGQNPNAFVVLNTDTGVVTYDFLYYDEVQDFSYFTNVDIDSLHIGYIGVDYNIEMANNNGKLYWLNSRELTYLKGNPSYLEVNGGGGTMLLFANKLQVDSLSTNGGGIAIDANTGIYLDGSNNLTFDDAVAGTKTLAELAAGTWPGDSLFQGPYSATGTKGLILVDGVITETSLSETTILADSVIISDSENYYNGTNVDTALNQLAIEKLDTASRLDANSIPHITSDSKIYADYEFMTGIDNYGFDVRRWTGSVWGNGLYTRRTYGVLDYYPTLKLEDNNNDSTVLSPLIFTQYGATAYQRHSPHYITINDYTNDLFQVHDSLLTISNNGVPVFRVLAGGNVDINGEYRINGSPIATQSTYIAWAISDSTTELTTANGDDIRAVYDCTIDSVLIAVNKAPTGSTLTFDIENNGTSIFSTTPTIDDGETSTATAATSYVLSTTTISWNDKLTGKVTSAGATYGGSGAKIYMYITKN